MPQLTNFRLSLLVVVMLLFRNTTQAQYELRLSKKVSLGYHPNIETYFIAERLAVQHIGFMVFTRKDSAYPHQPLLTAAYAQFSKYTESPTIIRIAQLVGSLRDRLHDNAQIIPLKKVTM